MEAGLKQDFERDSTATPAAGFRSLLVALDLTPSSDRILGRVARLPFVDGARVTLVHVVPGGLPQADRRRAERDANKALTSEVRHLRKELPKQVRLDVVVKAGSASSVIAKVATEARAELIVMGRGSGGLRDVFLGSTAERVIRHAQLPVLVVRLPPRSAYGRPMLALDLDQAAHEIVRLLLLVVSPPRPVVEVVHAFDLPYRGLVYPSLTEDDAEDWKEELREGAAREVGKLLAAALVKANVRPDAGLRYKTRLQYGSPRIVVEKAMKKSSPDLLVLGTRGHTGAAYMFLGTVAGDLLRAAKCDVLVVPPTPSRG